MAQHEDRKEIMAEIDSAKKHICKGVEEDAWSLSSSAEKEHPYGSYARKPRSSSKTNCSGIQETERG